MAKCKKGTSKFDSDPHRKSTKHKYKHNKIKKKLHSFLNRNHLHINDYSHPRGKHLNSREISDVINSSWNVEIYDTSRCNNINGKKHNLNKKFNSHEKNHLSCASLSTKKTNDIFRTKAEYHCNEKHNLNDSSWKVETNVYSSKNVIKRKSKKQNKTKCVLKETNENLLSHLRVNSGLLGSILISDDTEAQSEQDESFEIIARNKVISKSNVNFVSFNTENVNDNCSKTSKKKKLKRIKNLESTINANEDSDVIETIEIDEISNSDSNSKHRKSIKKNKVKSKKIEVDTIDCNNKAKSLKKKTKGLKKCKKKDKKAKMESNIKHNSENEISSCKSDTEVEVIESTETSELNHSIPSSSKINEVEIVENSDTKLNDSTYNIHKASTDDDGLENCQYYVLDNVCIVILRHPTKLYFNGILKVSLIVGNVEVLGFKLTIQPQIVHSLRGSSFLCFETIKDESSSSLSKDLTGLGLNKNVIDSIKPLDCIIKLEPCSMSRINFINNYIRQKIIPYSRRSNDMEQCLKCSFDFKHHTGSIFKRNSSWNEPLQSIMSTVNTKTIICGGKSVGKSTLFRYTVNKLLSINEAVLCLDFDVGQSEFCVAGCISAIKVTTPLLGPNYTYLQKPDRSYFIGSVSVNNNIDEYITAIKQILDYCSTNTCFQNIPWVINTMGYVRGIGFEIMIHLTRMIQPTHLIQILSDKHHNNYPRYLSPELFFEAQLTNEWAQSYSGYCTHQLFVINSIAKNTDKDSVTDWQFQPKEMRYMTMLSYLNDIVKDDNESLLDVRPFVANMKNIKLVNFNLTLDEKLIPCIFNGNFVALCNEQIVEDKILYICEGFGIVRGIDNDDVYLLTPLSLKELKNVTHILLAAEPLPPSVYMNSKCLDCSIPYVSSSNRIRTTVAPRRATFNILKTYLQKKRNETNS